MPAACHLSLFFLSSRDLSIASLPASTNDCRTAVRATARAIRPGAPRAKSSATPSDTLTPSGTSTACSPIDNRNEPLAMRGALSDGHAMFTTVKGPSVISRRSHPHTARRLQPQPTGRVARSTTAANDSSDVGSLRWELIAARSPFAIANDNPRDAFCATNPRSASTTTVPHSAQLVSATTDSPRARAAERAATSASAASPAAA